MRHCSICNKGSRMGGARKLLRGHYNPTSRARKYPNLQFSKVNGVRKLICARCLKTLHKGKA